MDKFLETIHDMIEIITGKRPGQKTERAKGFTEEHTQQWLDSVKGTINISAPAPNTPAANPEITPTIVSPIQ